MLSPVSTSNPWQNAQSLFVQQKQVQQKQQDDVRVRNSQQPSTLNAQRTNNTVQNQLRSDLQNSQQLKGASLDVRA